eukprot:GHVU01069624.1.p1 GENE.GHVU01069624.1~~GHVU01069624.1.p1  ORF type:complete len:187 (+),score=8.95 GHVU01069624.1:348-908(+)
MNEEEKEFTEAGQPERSRQREDMKEETNSLLSRSSLLSTHLSTCRLLTYPKCVLHFGVQSGARSVGLRHRVKQTNNVYVSRELKGFPTAPHSAPTESTEASYRRMYQCTRSLAHSLTHTKGAFQEGLKPLLETGVVLQVFVSRRRPLTPTITYGLTLSRTRFDSFSSLTGRGSWCPDMILISYRLP